MFFYACKHFFMFILNRYFQGAEKDLYFSFVAHVLVRIRNKRYTKLHYNIACSMNISLQQNGNVAQ